MAMSEARMSRVVYKRPTDSRFIDRAGERHGKLVVRCFFGRLDGHSLWKCDCDCGGETIVDNSNLGRHATSCGCVGRATHKTHGLSSRTEYTIWYDMIQRCHKPTDVKYKLYGARGICVCDRWRGSVEAFLVDMGPRPSARHTIDRIDNDENYCPENCRWATYSEQNRNRRPFTHKRKKT